MFSNYAALLQKGAPVAHQAKSKSGSTYTPMKFMEILAARPMSLFLIAVIILSVGVAVRIAGPISIHIPRVEIPTIEIHAGSAPVVAEPKDNVAPLPRQSQRKHHSHRSRAGVLNKVVGGWIFLKG
jgi:hypothetical protein